jgi:hypothetical protein
VTARRRYGFALWWPGLVLGVALAAAAYAKLKVSGLSWIASGAVRYHYVTDAQNAPTTWGLEIASSHGASIAVSALAIVFEAGFVILAARAARPVARLALGVGALAFFAGLYLLQGVWWEPWLVLLLPPFLPWDWIRRSPPDVAFHERLTVAQRGCVWALIATQLIASGLWIEREPLLSNYPMYSHTYESPAEFDRHMAWRFTSVSDVRLDGTSQIQDWPRLSEHTRRMLLIMSESADELSREDLAGICSDVGQWAGSVPQTLSLTATRSGFDWAAGAFLDVSPVPVRTLALKKECSLL